MGGHPLVFQANEPDDSTGNQRSGELETPIFDLLDNDVFNLVVVAVANFWGSVFFGIIITQYYIVQVITNAIYPIS